MIIIIQKEKMNKLEPPEKHKASKRAAHMQRIRQSLKGVGVINQNVALVNKRLETKCDSET